MIMPDSYGQEPKNFGYKQLPDKLVEGTEGILQIYGLQKNIPIPSIIDNLIITSSNQNIVKILDLSTNQNTSITSVKLSAVNSGTANIAIAAPGFASEEFSITIYDIKQGEQKLLLKTVPDTFTINGPTTGYFSVELADIDSNPTLAKKDTVIFISTSNSEIITLSQKEITIKEGEYFAVGEFKINNPGEVLIYAESQNIESGSDKITVFGGGTDKSTTSKEDYKIQLYVIPEKISNFATSSTFAIVQLQGPNGSPIKATENIPISLKIDYPKPTFGQRPPNEISTVNSLLIPQGSSVGYAKLSVTAGLEETYEVTISAEDYLVSDSAEFQTILTYDVDDPKTTLETIPLLASGAEELIGVLYPSDSNGVSLLNLNTVNSEINSSDRDALSISDDRMGTGSGAKLIFGKMGQIKPEVLEVTVIGEEKQTIFPIVYGPERLELRLISDSLVSKVMPGTDFPIVAYLAAPNNASWYFPDTSNVVMGPNEFVKTSVQTVSEGQSVIFLQSKSLKEGKVNLNFEVNEFTTTVPFETGVAKPAKVDLAFPDHLLSGMKNTLSLQILDDKETPLFANNDIEFRITANDNSIELPQTVTVKKGTYHSLFDIIPKKVVKTEISVLASDFPLSKFNINTVETTPTLIISTVNSIVVGEEFDLVLDAKILDVPLENIIIDWNIQGAQVQEISESTDSAGKIKLTLTANDVERIQIQAKALDFDQITISKEIIVTKSAGPVGSTVENENLLENNMVFILVPGAVIGSSILLRKRGLLDPVTERFPIVESIFSRFDDLLERLEFAERFEGIKEKIPIIKNR